MFFSALSKYDNSEKSENILKLTSNLEGVGSYVTWWFAMIIMKQMLWIMNRQTPLPLLSSRTKLQSESDGYSCTLCTLIFF